MNADRWQQIKSAFNEVLRIEPIFRSAYLQVIGEKDPDLKQRVEVLLAEHENETDEFLRDPAAALDIYDDLCGRETWLGKRIGPYKIVAELGTGGMAEVYLAKRDDAEFDQQVAIKLIRSGHESAASVVRRFKSERRILAGLDHPNIARLLDGGRTPQGQLYLVMEYVAGLPITEFCDTKRLNIHARLKLLVETCKGVQHAHRNAIIHRDLKPSNILVVDREGQFVPRIIDFGVAKVARPAAPDSRLLTRFGQFMGTPAYMSPEQADPSALGIDTRTDVYSLGVILFELLTGTLPFANKELPPLSDAEIARRLRAQGPPSPSATVGTYRDASAVTETRSTGRKHLIRFLQGDLDWITLKALEADRERRYGSPAELAADLERHLNQDAVLARPASTAYKIRTFVRHHRVGVGVAIMAAVFAIFLSIAGLIAIQRQHEAQFQMREALSAQSRLLIQTAAQRLKNADVAGAQRVILEVLTDPRFAQARTTAALSEFQDIRAADRQLAVLSGHDDSVNFAEYSPDSTHIVTASLDHTARIWDARTGAQTSELKGACGYVYHAAYSPDGAQIVTASADGTARIWDAASGAQLSVLARQSSDLYYAAYSPDGSRIVTASFDDSVNIWDARTGIELAQLIGHKGYVNFAAYSPDGKHIVTASDDQTARIWDARTGAALGPLFKHRGAVISAAYSPDGTRIVTASADKTARVWDARTGAQLAVLPHGGYVYTAFYSRDGSRIVTASGDKVASLWSAATYTLVSVLSGHEDAVYSAVFSADGMHVVTASNDGTARIWSTRAGAELAQLTGHAAGVNFATFSPDGLQILSASDDQTARISDSYTGATLRVLSTRDGGIYRAAFSPDASRIVTASDENIGRVWDLSSGSVIADLTGHDGSVHSAAFSIDGTRIVSASSDKTARIWNAGTGAQIATLSGHTRYVYSAAYSPDGQRIVTASEDGTARVWDAWTGVQLALLSGHDNKVYSAAFSPDGSRIVTASEDRSARIWDAGSGAQLAILSGHQSAVYFAAYSPDSAHIVTASMDRSARIWDARSGEQLAALFGHSDRVNSVAYSPDGGRIVTASADQTVRVWNSGIPASVSDQILWSLAAEFDPLSTFDHTQLGIPLDPSVRRWPDPGSACDRAAAAFYDPTRLAPGVRLAEIKLETATLACAGETASSENDANSAYQLGRVLFAKGDTTGARRWFESAIDRGYPAALVDLASLLSNNAASADDISPAVSLYERAWRKGISIAAFRLGQLYETGRVPTNANTDADSSASLSKAWFWYQLGADAGEPFALGRFAERSELAALAETNRLRRNEILYQAFVYYASAAKRSQTQAWPDVVWKHWRYRRATLARLLAHEGMMHETAGAYSKVLSHWKD